MLQNLRKFVKKSFLQQKKNKKSQGESININPNSLEAIKSLRIPKNNIEDSKHSQNPEDYDIIKIDSMPDNFPGEFLTLSDIINKTIKDIQDMFKKSSKDLEIGKILTHKDELIENGIIFKENGDYYAAFTNFYFAFQLANKLNQKDEAEVLLDLINDLKSKLDKKIIDKFNKKYVKAS